MPDESIEVIIGGSGPARLQAGIDGVRAEARCTVLGRQHKSRFHNARIEKFCCYLKLGGESLNEAKGIFWQAVEPN